MLTLSRKENQSLIITLNDSVDPSMTVGELFAIGKIKIVIGDISGSQVKLNIDAPREFQIYRAELLEYIQEPG